MKESNNGIIIIKILFNHSESTDFFLFTFQE